MEQDGVPRAKRRQCRVSGQVLMRLPPRSIDVRCAANAWFANLFVIALVVQDIPNPAPPSLPSSRLAHCHFLFPFSFSALESILGMGCKRGGELLSLRLDVSTPSPPPKREEEEQETDGQESLAQEVIREEVGGGWSSSIVSRDAPQAFKDSSAVNLSCEQVAGLKLNCSQRGVREFGQLGIAGAAQTGSRRLQVTSNTNTVLPELHHLHLGSGGSRGGRPWQSSEWTVATLGSHNDWNLSAPPWAADLATAKNPFLAKMEALEITSTESTPLHSFSSSLSASLRSDIGGLGVGGRGISTDLRGAVITSRGRGGGLRLGTLEEYQRRR